MQAVTTKISTLGQNCGKTKKKIRNGYNAFIIKSKNIARDEHYTNNHKKQIKITPKQQGGHLVKAPSCDRKVSGSISVLSIGALCVVVSSEKTLDANFLTGTCVV